jgi:hypothetical protein
MNPGPDHMIYDESRFNHRQYIKKYLDEIFPNDIAKLIGTYDRHLEGTITNFVCYPERLLPIHDNLPIHDDSAYNISRILLYSEMDV